MALTCTSRGFATSTSSTATWVCTPGSYPAAGSTLVFAIAYNNSGTSGADPGVTSVTDSRGNTWGIVLGPVTRSPGNVSGDGLVFRIYTTRQDVGTLSGTDTITVNFQAAVVAKSFNLWEVPAASGYYADYAGGNSNSGAGNPTITTASIPVGDLTIGFTGNEYGTAQTRTGDSDTTNGSWSSSMYTEGGSTGSGMNLGSQYKLQTTTGSTQTFNPTYATSTDYVHAYVTFHEAAASVSVTPGVVNLATTLFAPVIGAGLVIPVSSLSLTTYEPTVTVAAAANPVLAEPTTASLTTTAYAPTVTAGGTQLRTPPAASLATATFAPTVTAGGSQLRTPPVAALTLTTYAPTVTAIGTQLRTPPAAALALTTYAPTVTAGGVQLRTPPAATLTTSTFAPTVTAIGTQLRTPPAASLALTTYAPDVSAGASATVTPPAASLSLTAFAPDTVISDHKVATPPAASLLSATFAPTVGVSDNIVVTPDPASLVLTALAPLVTAGGSITVTPGTASLAITATVPRVTVKVRTKLTRIMDGLHDAMLANGYELVYAHPVGSASVPCVIVDYPTRVTYDLVWQRGADRFRMVLWVVAGASSRSTYTTLAAALSGLPGELDGQYAWGSVRVAKASVGAFPLNGVPYTAGRFEVEVVA